MRRHRRCLHQHQPMLDLSAERSEPSTRWGKWGEPRSLPTKATTVAYGGAMPANVTIAANSPSLVLRTAQFYGRSKLEQQPRADILRGWTIGCFQALVDRRRIALEARRHGAPGDAAGNSAIGRSRQAH